MLHIEIWNDHCAVVFIIIEHSVYAKVHYPGTHSMRKLQITTAISKKLLLDPMASVLYIQVRPKLTIKLAPSKVLPFIQIEYHHSQPP